MNEELTYVEVELCHEQGLEPAQRYGKWFLGLQITPTDPGWRLQMTPFVAKHLARALLEVAERYPDDAQENHEGR